MLTLFRHKKDVRPQKSSYEELPRFFTFRPSHLITTLTYVLMDNFCPCFFYLFFIRLSLFLPLFLPIFISHFLSRSLSLALFVFLFNSPSLSISLFISIINYSPPLLFQTPPQLFIKLIISPLSRFNPILK